MLLLAARVHARTLVLVPLHVQGQVVRSGEGARAHGALEGLSPRVLPVVARQLVRTGEAPVTVFPRAPVGLLTWRRGEKRRGKEERRALDGSYSSTDSGSANTHSLLHES